MRSVSISPLAQQDLDSAADWYDAERPGLGNEFLDQAARVIEVLRTREQLVTAPYDVFPTFVVRRAFPFRAFFVGTDDARDVIAFQRDGRDEERWRARL